MAKPVVDGIERELESQDALLIRLSVSGGPGRVLATQYGVRGVPTLLVLDRQGNSLLTQVGRIQKNPVLEAIAKAK